MLNHWSLSVSAATITLTNKSMKTDRDITNPDTNTHQLQNSQALYFNERLLLY